MKLSAYMQQQVTKFVSAVYKHGQLSSSPCKYTRARAETEALEARNEMERVIGRALDRERGETRMAERAALSALREARKHNSDPEKAHIMADAALIEFLTTVGFTDMVDEFNKVEGWYA